MDSVLLFEGALEVCRKVGGIYTVLRTKVPYTVKTYGDRYHLFGLFDPRSVDVEFEEEVPPENILPTVTAMRNEGVGVHYGRWLIPGYPRVILFELASLSKNLEAWKYSMWTDNRISTPADDIEVNDAVLYGYACYWFLEDFHYRFPDKKKIAHFHEWNAGVTLLRIAHKKLPVATIFTTHATLIGRYVCAGGSSEFYHQLPHMDAAKEAGTRQIYHRFEMEKAATHCATVFTTVSEITGDEAKYVLQRNPDFITPNGLNVIRFAALHEFQNLHAQFKAKINDFIRGHFYANQDFDLDETLYFVTAGRYEVTNKGVDVMIDALQQLNQKLKQYNSKRTVVAFIVMPAPHKSFNVEALRGQALLRQLRETCQSIQENVGKKLFDLASAGKVPSSFEDLMSQEDLVSMKRRIYANRGQGNPPIVTHNMIDDGDQVLTRLRAAGLLNSHSDRVKVIFHPEFITSANPLFNMDYEQFVRGCHLGVFPSYYEPWGYTPAEATVMGVPSVCSDLCGFGNFMKAHVEDTDQHGVYVIQRRHKQRHESVAELADVMFRFCQLSRRERIQLRNRTERLSQLLDWEQLGQCYETARKEAFRRVEGLEDDWLSSGIPSAASISLTDGEAGEMPFTRAPMLQAPRMSRPASNMDLKGMGQLADLQAQFRN